jgi:transcriptional regulator with XRE-family HTH domain
MRYHEILQNAIKTSRYTLLEISNQASKHGLSATREYLSRLQNGKVPPASKKLNIFLAELLGVDDQALLIAAHKEQMPEEVRTAFSSGLDNTNHVPTDIKVIKKEYREDWIEELNNSSAKHRKAMKAIWEQIKGM